MNTEQTNMGAFSEANRRLVLKCPLTNTRRNKLQQKQKQQTNKNLQFNSKRITLNETYNNNVDKTKTKVVITTMP